MRENILSDGQGHCPGGLVVKNPPANAGDVGSVPGSGGTPGEGNGNSLQYSCLGNPMDRGAWERATVPEVMQVSHNLATKPPPPPPPPQKCKEGYNFVFYLLKSELVKFRQNDLFGSNS